MKVVAIIQARYGSSRLSGKSMRPLAGKPMLSHVLDRAKAVRGVDAVVLATSTQVENAQLTWLADDMQIAAYRCDNEQNVLRRFVQVAVVQGADVIMRITGDCPLLAPDVCADVLAAHLAAHDDVIEVLKSGDVARAQDGITKHILGAKDRILAYYERTFSSDGGSVRGG
mgnify:CR=1 FL=1